MLNLRANSIPSPQQRDMAERLWTARAQAMRWNDIAGMISPRSTVRRRWDCMAS
nr:Uncharacterised protein [Klebsiella pneumoniae]